MYSSMKSLPSHISYLCKQPVSHPQFNSILVSAPCKLRRRARLLDTFPRSVAESGSTEESENPLISSGRQKWIELLRQTTDQEWSGFKELARIHNFVPSCLLVFVGALKTVGLSAKILLSMRVWTMAFVAGGVALASVTVNDYFDFIAGIDTVNEPTKPLPSGLIRPDIALLVTLVLYVAVLVAGCVMEPPLLRWIIAFSAASTLVYTPLLKSLTLIKNFVVASVIALSPLSGALASGMGMSGFKMLQNATGFIFGSIMFREILMDIMDVEGDKSASVHTLPVVLGRVPSLILALVFLTIGSVFGGMNLRSGHGFQYLSQYISTIQARWLVLIPYFLVISRMYFLAYTVWRDNFSKETLLDVISKVMTQLGLGFVLILVLC